MHSTPVLRFALFFALIVAPWAVGLRADDWPGFRGPHRDGICREKGLLKEWPSEGPKLLWKVTGMGIGNSAPSVVGNVLYTMGQKDGKEWVLALDASREGKQIWASPIGPVRYDGNGFPGPRSTPTIDGNRLYTLGIAGDVVCMEFKRGRILWRRDVVKDFGGRQARLSWGYAESVLVDGPLVICTPGGPKNTIVALNKNNGRLVWGSPVGDPAAYASVIKVMVGKSKQYVNLTAKGVIGVAAKNGKLLWRYDAPASRVANCAACVTSGDTVFAASAYGTGGGLVQITPSGSGFTADQVYFTKKMQNHHGGMVLVDGYLYGCSNPSVLTCLDYKTGKIKWADRTAGKCSVLWADGMLYCRDENGPISLVEATPQGFRLKGRFDQPDRSDRNSWPYLVIANGVMYVRDQDVLLAYDVRGEK
ncbi:MAG: PQQ-binding-like beta-propeller repeat protein [Thermoguttaceae bacterium]